MEEYIFVNQDLNLINQENRSKNARKQTSTSPKQYNQYHFILSYKLPYIIEQFYQATKELIWRFIETDSFLANNLIQKTELRIRLDNICKPQQFKESRYKYQQVYSICQDIIVLKIKDILQKMSEQEHQSYLTIIQFNNTLVSGGIVEQVYKDLTIQRMVKIDALSTFFKKNIQIKNKYGKYFKDVTLSNKVLAKVFKQIESSIKGYHQRYAQFEAILEYSYEQQFQPIANLLCLNQFKYKLSLSKLKVPQYFGQKITSTLIIQSNANQQEKPIHYPFNFRLCEIVFLKKSKQQKNELNQMKEKELLQKMREFESLQKYKVKRQFIKLISIYGLSILSASVAYMKFQNKQHTKNTDQK